MARQVEFHPEAIAEARAARGWYESKSTSAAAGFIAELDAAVANIQDAPERWPPYLSETGVVLSGAFPTS